MVRRGKRRRTDGRFKKLRQREEIDDRYKWNIAAMYGDEKRMGKGF